MGYKPAPTFKTWYQGKELVEVTGRAMIFGVEYYDIIFPSGLRKTVPAKTCNKERLEEK